MTVGIGTAQQHAADSLRTMIASGRLRPGDRIRQEDLAERVGLSVAPVREALRVLEQEGQVVYYPRRGYFVNELSLKDLREIYDMRALLEEHAARHALTLLGAEDLERIEAAAAEAAASAERGDIGAELIANRRFHLLILETPDRPHTARVLRQLWDSTEAYRAMYYTIADERLAATGAHARITAALRERDADRLVEELDAHRERALVVLARLFDSRAEPPDG